MRGYTIHFCVQFNYAGTKAKKKETSEWLNKRHELHEESYYTKAGGKLAYLLLQEVLTTRDNTGWPALRQDGEFHEYSLQFFPSPAYNYVSPIREIRHHVVCNADVRFSVVDFTALYRLLNPIPFCILIRGSDSYRIRV